MTEPTYGQRLAAARKRHGFKTQDSLADAVGVVGKTIRNYETGKTFPDLATREKLRDLLGAFDAAGDQVEVAVRQSALVEWRQDDTIAHYKRHLYEQAREEAG